jgi:hypothetical protein
VSYGREDFYWKIAHQLCDTSQTIFVEGLNLVPLSRRILAKHCLMLDGDNSFTFWSNVVSKVVCISRRYMVERFITFALIVEWKRLKRISLHFSLLCKSKKIFSPDLHKNLKSNLSMK